jgi:hypothetical protein
MGQVPLREEAIMSASNNKQNNAAPTPEKDPDDWVTGDEQMTGPQASYLRR